MATLSSPSHDSYGEIQDVIHNWEGRVLLQQILLWIPRGLIVGLGICITLGVISRLRFILTGTQLAAVSVAVIIMTIVSTVIYVRTRRPTPLQSARAIDIEFRLKERLSTALELLDGRIHSHPELRDVQIADAQRVAGEIDPKRGVELSIQKLDVLITVMMTVSLILLILIPNQLEPVATGRSIAENSAFDEAGDTVRDITETIAGDTTLTEAEREQLLQTLESSLDTLQDPETSPEEAFAAMNDAENQLREKSNALSEQRQNQQSSLDAASEALNGSTNSSDSESDGGEGEIPPLSEQLEEMAQNLDGMNSEQLADAAQAMDAAAQQAANVDEQLSQSLQRAAEAMRRGDQQSASQAIDQARQQAQREEQQLTQQEQTEQNLEQSANQAQQASQQIAEAQQQDQMLQAQQAPQEGPTMDDGQQPGSEGDTNPGEGTGAQPNDQPSEQAGTSPGDDAPPVVGESENAQLSDDAQSSPSSGTIDQSGAGDFGGGETDTTAFSEQDGPVDQDNNPDGQGRKQYDPIFAPQRIGGEGGENQITLDPETGNVPLTEGEFSDNPTGESIVPYDEVFATYQDTVNRALESDYVPLGLRDVVRDYFTSLQPR